jgi:hypothetical protein
MLRMIGVVVKILWIFCSIAWLLLFAVSSGMRFYYNHILGIKTLGQVWANQYGTSGWGVNLFLTVISLVGVAVLVRDVIGFRTEKGP